VQDNKPTGANRVLCPICQGPLKWAGDAWIVAFECETCGEFADFDRAFSRTSSSGARPGGGRRSTGLKRLTKT
jgi:hypothetical protein